MNTTELKRMNWRQIMEHVAGDRLDIHDALTALGTATTRYLAARMQRDVLSVRPRVTELFQLGLVAMVGRDGNEGLYQAIPLAQAEKAHNKAMVDGEQMVMDFAGSSAT